MAVKTDGHNLRNALGLLRGRDWVELVLDVYVVVDNRYKVQRGWILHEAGI